MSQRKKEILGITFLIIAFGIVGHMDYQDEKCSWNGCSDNRFEDQQ